MLKPLAPFGGNDPHDVRQVAPRSDPSFLDGHKAKVSRLADRVPHGGFANAGLSCDGTNAKLAIAGSFDLISDHGKGGLFRQ